MEKSIYKIISIIVLVLSVNVVSAQFTGNSSQNAVDIPRDGIFDDIHAEFKKPIPYPHLRQADVMYQKRIWQKIDFREKMNQPFYYPINAHMGWKSFIRTILDAVLAGELTAYDDLKDDEFTTALTLKEINKRLEGPTKLVDQYDENDNVIGQQEKPTEQYQEGEVKSLKIKEVWYFDKLRSKMMVRILGIGPMREYFDSDGDFQNQQLFWIYFPHARPLLAKTLVFDGNNSGARLSYDDIFMKRRFSSFVYKEENVYDRDISQYAVSEAALLESERIKNEIFEMEQSLWEY